MLLTIDTARLEQLLKAKEPQYVVTSSHLMGSGALPVKAPSSAIHGASFSFSGGMIALDGQIRALRQKVIESGMKLRAADVIDREIDEMRRNAT